MCECENVKIYCFLFMLFSPGYSLVGGPAPAVPRPFLGPPLLAPHHPLHPLLYSHQAAIPRTGFTLPGSATTLFPLPGTFPWSAGFRGQLVKSSDFSC